MNPWTWQTGLAQAMDFDQNRVKLKWIGMNRTKLGWLGYPKVSYDLSVLLITKET